MKKYILSFAALAATLSAAALGLKNQPVHAPVPDGKFIVKEFSVPMVAPQRAQTVADDASSSAVTEVYYSEAGDPKTALGYNNQRAGMQAGMAMQIAPDFAARMVGNEITSIRFYTGTEYSSQTSSVTSATVFISTDLTADPVYTQDVVCPAQAFAEVNAVLDTPYLIEAGKKIYVGAYLTLPSANYLPLVIDYSSHNTDYGGWAGIRNNSKSQWQWENIAGYGYGFVCVGATIKGSEFPENDVAVPAMGGMPVSYQDQPFEVDFMVKNNGANEVKTMKVEYGVAGETPIVDTFEFSTPLAFNNTQIIAIPNVVVSTPGKEIDINVKVTEVNGVANNSDTSEGVFTVTIVPTGAGFDRNVVVEEFTSISCQFCPVGYTTMEYIHDTYPDGDLIPVCVHVNSPGNDPMTAATYNNVYRNYCGDGVPSSTINRTYTVYPYISYVEEAYEMLRSIPAIVNVNAEATYNAETNLLTVDTETAFAFDYTDGDSNFVLSYGVTEDNVGPYTQQNGYSGQSGDAYGWQNKPTRVQLVYNDVARQLDTYNGIKGSVPAEITAGNKYEFTHDIKLLQSITDVNNINLVVYVINKQTGAIENATTLKTAAIKGLSGIEDVTVDATESSAPVEYFNLQGVRVSNPQGGVFIRRQGSNVSKEYIK